MAFESTSGLGPGGLLGDVCARLLFLAVGRLGHPQHRFEGVGSESEPEVPARGGGARGSARGVGALAIGQHCVQESPTLQKQVRVDPDHAAMGN